MAFIPHIEGSKLPQRIGNDTALHARLWLEGMMNELRRRPDLIPPKDGKTPVSMQIPFLEGSEKVEYGYRAGAAFMTQKDDTTIELKNTHLFPACISLVLISVWYEAYEKYRQNFSCTLLLPDTEDSSEFRYLISAVKSKLSFLELNVQTYTLPQEPSFPPRRASGCLFTVTDLQQIDIGRFVVSGHVQSGSFSVRDNITLTDGRGTVLRENCPIQGIYVGPSRREVDHVTIGSGLVYIAIAFWFPAGAAFDSLSLVKELLPPTFDLPVMPPEVHLCVKAKKKGFFSRFFS